MVSFESEQILSLKDAVRHIPGRPHSSTIHRWANRGSRGKRLETIRVGGRRYISIEAIERFISAISERPCSVQQKDTSRTCAGKKAAAAFLDQHGI
ncbi:MAG: DUF1580 domain-containing protein [Planctomycetota bacterium]|nr:DUF1580 domain-containing protein [Planctomycetota bacterium]